MMVIETNEVLRIIDSIKFLQDEIALLRKQVLPQKESPTQSEAINELATALAKAQGEMEIASRCETNPFFKSKYADINELIRVSRPSLSKNGLAVIQQILTSDDGITMLHTILTHTSGQWIETRMRIVPAKNDVQSFGSCVTYLRRYAYGALINIAVADEDDDGEAAVFAERTTMAKGTALNTKYNPKESSHETITKEQREELDYELSDYSDVAEMILEGFKIRSIADMPKAKFMAAITRVREIKMLEKGNKALRRALMKKTTLYRYSPPTRYDQHLYGTEIVLLQNNIVKEIERYIQCSHDQDNPRWEKISLAFDLLIESEK